MIRDGHVHTPFCPHGTKDSLRKYIEQALLLDYSSITFTEHAPLPENFNDPVPEKDSGMNPTLVEAYLKAVEEVKEEYKSQIQIHVGFEVDYIEGFEEETKKFLNTYGPYLSDSILSVHFLKMPSNEYLCLDYHPDMFDDICKRYGSVFHVYQKYYQTLLMAVQSNLGTFKPNRVGHITLVRKFQKLFPNENKMQETLLIDQVLEAIVSQNLTLDINGAGTNKKYCLEPYPDESIIKKAAALNIPLIYGSDAHQAHDLGQGLSQLPESLLR